MVVPEDSVANRFQVFVSFDGEHDRDLYERLLRQSRAVGSPFDVLYSSDCTGDAADASDSVRASIEAADHAIFICGVHTGKLPRMTAELRLVHEEGTPYALLWGRREAMCKKPTGAISKIGIYSWTREILHDLIVNGRRRARADAERSAALRKRVRATAPEENPSPKSWPSGD